MRETGTIWQIGVFTGKPRTFLGSKMGHFRHFGTPKIMTILKALEVKLHIPSPCLDASKNGLLLEFIAQKGVPTRYD